MNMPASDAQRITLGHRLHQLEEEINRMKQLEIEAVQARHAANVEEWKRFLAAAGSVEHRKIASRLATSDLAFTAELAEAEVRHAGRMVRLLDKRVDVGRTYSANLRAESHVLGVFGPGDGTP